ncbi:MAG: DUF3606 domain-containing protein [Ramlibacter sp.]
MSDDKSNRGPADAARINVSEDYEVRYWTKKFGVNADKLRDAVSKVGPVAAKVEAELKSK